jgi:hypothetical protein
VFKHFVPDDFRLCSSEPPAIDVRVTHPVHGAGTVTHVELEYKLQHSCTLYIDAATNKATRPSVCTCGYFRRTLLPCDGLSYTYAHRKISESDDSLVNKQHDLRYHPDAQQACHGKGSVPPGMPSVAVTTNQQVACGMFLIPAEALAREERAMQTAIGGGCAKTRRYNLMSDAVKGLIPIAKNSDRNAALFILSLQALEEVYSSKCEQHGEILVGDHRVPLYGGSGVQRRERAKPVAKRLQGAAPTEGTVGVKRARLPGLCQRCAKLGVERGMVDADDPVLNHNKIDRCILKAPYDPAKVDCTWSQLVSYATTLPPGWVHTTLVDANFPSGRTIKFRVPRVRYPTGGSRTPSLRRVGTPCPAARPSRRHRPTGSRRVRPAGMSDGRPDRPIVHPSVQSRSLLGTERWMGTVVLGHSRRHPQPSCPAMPTAQVDGQPPAPSRPESR